MAITLLAHSQNRESIKMKKSLKIILWFLLTAGVLVATAVFTLTQPIIPPERTYLKTDSANAEQLQTLVRTLSETLPRTTGNENLNAARDFIKTTFETSQATVRLQAYPAQGKTFYNVIARFNGKRDCPLTVVGAHYDAYAGLPGADDNASGVAGLLELARILSLLKPLNCPVELVAYANEEPPFFRTKEMGSYIHAKSLHDNNTKVGMMICFDMIGYFSDEPGSQQFPVPLLKYMYSDVGNYIALVGDLKQIGQVRKIKTAMQSTMDTAVRSINAPVAIPGIDFSDHMNYWHFGYPGVMLTDTAFNRNREYHTPNDTWDRLNYVRMADVINGVVKAVISQ